MTALGEKLRGLRKKKGYTLEKLAELTELSKSYIWELENKNPPRPSGEKIAKIASVLGVTAEYLLDPTVSGSLWRMPRTRPSFGNIAGWIPDNEGQDSENGGFYGTTRSNGQLVAHALGE